MANADKYVIESVAADKRRSFHNPDHAVDFPHNYELVCRDGFGREYFYAYAFSRKVDEQFALFFGDQAEIEARFGDNCDIWGIANTAEQAEFRVYKKLREYADQLVTGSAIPQVIEDRTRFAPL